MSNQAVLNRTNSIPVGIKRHHLWSVINYGYAVFFTSEFVWCVQFLIYWITYHHMKHYLAWVAWSDRWFKYRQWEMCDRIKKGTRWNCSCTDSPVVRIYVWIVSKNNFCSLALSKLKHLVTFSDGIVTHAGNNLATHKGKFGRKVSERYVDFKWIHPSASILVSSRTLQNKQENFNLTR